MLRVGSGRGPFARALVEASSATPFSPLTLFASGEKGWWLSPVDPTKLFQNQAGTTAVTTVGEPVGFATDLSGNGENFTQGTDANRLTWSQDANSNYYLSANGISQQINKSVTLPAGLRQLTACMAFFSRTQATKRVLNIGTGTTTGTASVAIVPGDFGQILIGIRLSGRYFLYYNDQWTPGASAIKVITVQFDNNTSTDGDNVRLRINGVDCTPVSASGTQTLADFITTTHRLLGGSAGTDTLDGGAYETIVRYATSTTEEIANMEAYVANLAGVTL